MKEHDKGYYVDLANRVKKDNRQELIQSCNKYDNYIEEKKKRVVKYKS